MKPDYLTDSQLCHLWPQLNDMIDGDDELWRKMASYVALLFATGMRAMEAGSLKLEGCITAPEAVIWLEKEDSSTKKHARWVGIFTPFRPRFIKYVEERKREGGIYLFPGAQPWRHINRTTTGKWWNRVMERCGMPKSSPKIARSTFATWMPHVRFQTKHGPMQMNSEQLSATLGHSRDVMYSYYQKPTPGHIFPSDDGPEWVEFVDKNTNGEGNLIMKEEFQPSGSRGPDRESIAELAEWRKKRKEKVGGSD